MTHSHASTRLGLAGSIQRPFGRALNASLPITKTITITTTIRLSLVVVVVIVIGFESDAKRRDPPSGVRRHCRAKERYPRLGSFLCPKFVCLRAATHTPHTPHTHAQTRTKIRETVE